MFLKCQTKKNFISNFIHIEAQKNGNFERALNFIAFTIKEWYVFGEDKQ